MLSTRLTIITFLAGAFCCTGEGLYYDVACPGVNILLQCPEGQEVDVVAVDHGVVSNADCNARNVPAKVSEEKKLHSQMLSWAKSVYKNLERCRLAKVDSRMFLRGYTPDGFIQVTYDCLTQFPNTEKREAIACDGEKATLACESGKIDIVRANFGRIDENTCTDTPSTYTFCMSLEGDETVKEMCNGKSECTVTATSSELGNPYSCDKNPDVKNYLVAYYVCE